MPMTRTPRTSSMVLARALRIPDNPRARASHGGEKASQWPARIQTGSRIHLLFGQTAGQFLVVEIARSVGLPDLLEGPLESVDDDGVELGPGVADESPRSRTPGSEPCGSCGWRSWHRRRRRRPGCSSRGSVACRTGVPVRHIPIRRSGSGGWRRSQPSVRGTRPRPGSPRPGGRGPFISSTRRR